MFEDDGPGNILRDLVAVNRGRFVPKVLYVLGSLAGDADHGLQQEHGRRVVCLWATDGFDVCGMRRSVRVVRFLL